jgi:YfiH family protein
VKETPAVSFNGGGDSWNVRRVDAEADNIRHHEMIPPSPDPSFRWRPTSAGAVLVCEPLERFAPHFFTTRLWRLGTPDPEVAEEAAWAQVAIEIASPLGVARARQVHGRAVVIADKAGAGVDGDILITRDRRLAIAVQAADCVPLLFVDPGQGAIAAAHAGWRGMAGSVPQAAVAALERQFGCRPEELLVAAGPSIGACCYEVGTDVRDAFIAAGWTDDDLDACFHGAPVRTSTNPSFRQRSSSPDRWFFDGWACVCRQLQSAGVRRERIFSARLCTASHAEAFPSYRRDGARAGRIAGVIRLS